MGEHVSALQLDALAAELPVEPEVVSHIETCATCRSKLEALKTERAALMQEPRFAALLQQLQPAHVSRRSLPRWAPVLLAMAALLLVLFASQFLFKTDDTILKGQQTVELLKDGAVAVTRARVGDKLSLAVGAAGQKAVAAFTLDDKAEVSVLLPSTPIAAGARVHVGSVFEVTLGSLAVFACFGEHPLPMDSLRAELSTRAVRAGKTPLEASPPDGCVRTKLEVLP